MVWEKDGVNITGGEVNIGGDLRGRDKNSNDDQVGITPTPSKKPDQTSLELQANSQQSLSEWTEEIEQALVDSNVTQPVGKKVLKEWTDEKGKHRLVADDLRVKNEGVSKCSSCGASLGSNPYTKICTYCSAANQQVYERVRTEEIDLVVTQEKTVGVEPQGGYESAVRKLVNPTGQSNNAKDSDIDGAYAKYQVNGGKDLSFDVVILDSLELNNCQDLSGKIIVPPGFKGIINNGSRDCGGLKPIKNSWAEIYAIVS